MPESRFVMSVLVSILGLASVLNPLCLVLVNTTLALHFLAWSGLYTLLSAKCNRDWTWSVNMLLHVLSLAPSLIFLHVVHLYNKINRLHSMSVTHCLLTLISGCCLIVSSALFQAWGFFLASVLPHLRCGLSCLGLATASASTYLRLRQCLDCITGSQDWVTRSF